jgi:hypothetical protein
MATIITGVVIAGLLVGFWPRSRRIDAHIETPIRQAAAPGERVFHRGCMLLASSSFCYSFVQLALSMFLGLLAFRLAGFTPGLPRGHTGEGEKRHRRARAAQGIPAIQVIGKRIVLIDGLFHQTQSEHAGIEIKIALWIGSNRGDVVKAVDWVHSRSLTN